ncbi:o-succinylbenzoate synthase [Skermania piniformis]|uniref:o-succinylbenzoate synthase n=1 Tax=Skermania pinensis TaxID=39122 RepID=A0ABX8SBU3_9ACTN|nr:o-succinylbenzoate synthase [Skermania piniformis]QXQ14464.1 o-succinylbenzoate synthase [Skermania piniformis]
MSAVLPDPADLLAALHVVRLPMRVRFRGITEREVALLHGPAGWGEFGAFPEYPDAEAAHWLAGAIEAAWIGPPPAVRARIPVNATVPAVPAEQVPQILARFPGVDTAKVKVAEPGQGLADDIARVAAVRARVPHVRVDANGGWSVSAAAAALREFGPLQYAEQPCRTVEELVALRRQVPDVPIAADESIRRAEDPLRVARAGGLDVAVVKVPPLGGMRQTLRIAEQLSGFGVPIVVSSALDTAVGMNAALAAAAALPELPLACGLATGEFFVDDLVTGRELRDGALAGAALEPEPDRLARFAAPPGRVAWWRDRVVRCTALLG